MKYVFNTITLSTPISFLFKSVSQSSHGGMVRKEGMGFYVAFNSLDHIAAR